MLRNNFAGANTQQYEKTRDLHLCKINMAAYVFRSSSVMCRFFILSLYLAQVGQASVAGWPNPKLN